MKDGVYTALITPFYEDGEIDFDALDKILNLQLKSNITGLVVLGTTGESPTLSKSEKQALVQMCIDKCKDKLKIVVGCGTNNTKTTLQEIALWNTYDIDQILLSLPSYNKPNTLGILKHTELCATQSAHPIMLYNIPNRTSLNLPTSILQAICMHPNITAIKEASGNLDVFFQMTNTKPNFKVFCGNDNQFLQTLKLGGSGVVSVGSNLFANSICNIYSLYKNGQTKKAESCFEQMQPFLNSLFLETNPVPIKYIMSNLGLCSSTVRLPLGQALPKTKDVLNNLSAPNFK